MKTSILTILILATGFCFGGCASSSTSTSSLVAAVTNPNNLAKAAQDAVAAVATAVLAKNPSYSTEVGAIADAVAALAASNPATVTSADYQAILSKTSLDTATQAEISAGITYAQGVFLNDFKTQLPSLNPSIALYLTAVANGLYIATGHATLPLPTVSTSS